VLELAVSIDIYSNTASLGELVAASGCEPGEFGSHERGSRRTKKTTWEHTRLGISSEAAYEADLEEHLQSIRSILAAARFDRGRLPADCRVQLTLGVFFDGITSFAINPRAIAKLGFEVDEIVICLYPGSNMDESERPDGPTA
jgi:hypothetical protein